MIDLWKLLALLQSCDWILQEIYASAHAWTPYLIKILGLKDLMQRIIFRLQERVEQIHAFFSDPWCFDNRSLCV